MHWRDGLLSWLVGLGAEIHSPARWEARDTGTLRGVGLFATCDLNPQEILFAIPPEAMVFAPDRFELAEWLVRERILALDEDDSDTHCESNENGDTCTDRAGAEDPYEDDPEPWHWFMRSLPPPGEEHRWPKGNAFYEAVRQDAHASKHALVQQAIDFTPEWIHEMGLVNHWLLSLALVSSRVHLVWTRDAYGDWVAKTALVPLADLLNGVAKIREKDLPQVNTVCETRKQDAFFLCRTTRKVKRGEELLVHYGDDRATEDDIAQTYGTEL